jgi:hypothetical protein
VLAVIAVELGPGIPEFFFFFKSRLCSLMKMQRLNLAGVVSCPVASASLRNNPKSQVR